MSDPAPEPAAFWAFSGCKRMRVYARTYYDRESGNYPAYPAYLTPKSMLNAQCLMLNDIPVGVG